MQNKSKIRYNNYMTKKIDYNFKGYVASANRHAIHQYPAMLHYKMVESLIKEFGGDILYDPFCGSGVSIVESLRQNKKVYGTDINPLALLIADVRAKNYNKDKLLNIFERIRLNYDPDIPQIKNMNYWFKEKNIEQLGKIRSFIKTIEDIEIKKFFLVVFSQAIRNSSLNKNGEFKRYRIKDIDRFDIDSFEEFERIFFLYINKLESLPFQDYTLLKHDTREPIPLNNVDIIITSPPYGDSKTTVAYGQFSSFSLDWLKELNPYGYGDLKLDSKMLGGKKIEVKELPSNAFYNIFRKIKKIDETRALEVFSFFYDLYLAIKNIVNTLNTNATVCFIVGNRMVKGVQIPMDKICAQIFESLGLKLIDIRVRTISNKRMPSKNSPTNKVGEKSSTMLNEYIVIMKNN